MRQVHSRGMTDAQCRKAIEAGLEEERRAGEACSEATEQVNHEYEIPIKFEPLSPKDIASYKTRTSQELKVGGRVNPANIPLSRNSPTSKSRFDFSKSPALAVKFFFTHITTDL
ncbi:hypothetical protein D9756_002843 [Leucocoprinus leucothites]|uniref:Uncharacterized protein n=1 Tax=Leucocoprinus leucothites TaxID=201217 RepID=A0A8H5LLF4_9AGAR|nr:hypothetical protein D9756_002843 [Leucoagaricus leucothites]